MARLLLIATSAILALLVLAPLGAIVVEAMGSPHGTGTNFFHVFASTDFRVAFFTTWKLAVAVCMLSLMLGTAVALWMDAAPPPAAGLFDALIVAPFLLPPYLSAVAWTLVAGPTGLLAQIGLPGSALAGYLYTLTGIAAVMALHLYPLVYTMVRAALLRTPRTLSLAARVHGAQPMHAWRVGVLPSLLPALAGAGLIVLLAGAEEFGIPAVLGGFSGIHVLSTQLAGAVDVWPVDLPRAAEIGLTMCLAGIFGWLVYRLFSLPAQDVSIALPSRHRWASLPLLVLFVGLGFGLPLAAILAVSFERAITQGVHAGNLTLAHYAHVLHWGASGWGALMTSVTLSIIAALGGMLCALAAAKIVQGRGRAARPVDMLATIPAAIPGVVLAVGLILFWNAPGNPMPIYGHPAILAFAYATVTFPYAYRYANAGLARITAPVTNAARVHGAGPMGLLLRVHLPLAWPMLVSGATVIFALSMRELVTSILLQPPGVQVVSTYVFNQFMQGNVGDGMAMSAVGVLTTTALLALARMNWAATRSRAEDHGYGEGRVAPQGA